MSEIVHFSINFTAAKIILNKFFNVSSADVEDQHEEATIPEENETVQTMTAKNDCDNEDLVDVQTINVSSESENEEVDDESVLIESQVLNVKSADATITKENPTVETEIVKNDSINEDVLKNDVTGEECKEEDEQEHEDNLNLESIENIYIMEKYSKEKFTCPVCEKEFKNQLYYREHFKSHKYGKKHKCRKCDSTFYMKSHLNNHEKFTCKHASTKLACPECDKEFRAPQALRYHMVLHEQPERGAGGSYNTKDMRYSDEIKQEALELLKKYSKAETAKMLKVTYSAITNWANSGKKSFKCSRCGKKLCDSTRLKKHERYACKGVK